MKILKISKKYPAQGIRDTCENTALKGLRMCPNLA
jgi:hypothetical protein